MDQNHSNGNSDSEVGSETLLPRNLFGVGREGEKFPEQRGEGGNTSSPQIYCHIYFHKWYL